MGYITLVLILGILIPLTKSEALTYDGSVKESIGYLIENNREFKKNRADWKTSQQNVREAASSAYPSINFNARYTYVGDILTIDFEQEGESPQKLKTATENMYRGTLSIEQLLFSGSVFGAIKVAKSYQNAADNKLIVQQNALVRGHLTSYAQVQMLADIMNLNKDMVESTKSHYEEAKLLYEIGATDNYTLLRAEVEHLNSIPAYRESEKLYKAAMSNLKLSLNLKETDELVLHPFDVDFEPPKNQDEIFNRLAETRSEIKMASFITEAYDRAVGIYGSQRLPTVSGFGNWERQNQWDLFSQNNYWNNSWVVGLNVSIPIFSGFRTSAQIQKGKLDLVKAREDESILRDQISLEAQLAYADYVRSSSDFDAWFRNVDLATEGFKIANLRWSNGDGSELELRDARIALQNAQVHLSRAKFDFLRTKIQLLYTLGEIDNIVVTEKEING